MKFVLFILIQLGTQSAHISTLVRGPSFDTEKQCVAAAAELEVRSEVPLFAVQVACEKERQT